VNSLHTDKQSIAEVQVNNLWSKHSQEETNTDCQSSDHNYSTAGESDSQHVGYWSCTNATDKPQQLTHDLIFNAIERNTDDSMLLLHCLQCLI